MCSDPAAGGNGTGRIIAFGSRSAQSRHPPSEEHRGSGDRVERPVGGRPTGRAGSHSTGDRVFAAAFAINGLLGPVVEELYFRGHLLPRIDRFGRAAPVLNAVLFSLYHFWTPWQNVGRILGLLPWIFTVWRKRSVALSMAVHISVNCIFLLLVLAAFTAD